MSITVASLACLLSIIYPEAKGESPRGQQAVAHVVLNRARVWRKSICQVVKERGQFVRQTPPKSFKFALKSNDPTNGALYFRNKGPRVWLGRRLKVKIGNHYFY